jgi:hypothetical protein
MVSHVKAIYYKGSRGYIFLMIKFTATGIQAIDRAPSFRLICSHHTLDRFMERVSGPLLGRDQIRNLLTHLPPIAYRQKNREPEIWYLLYKSDPDFNPTLRFFPAFALVAKMMFWADKKPPFAVRQGWLALTCLYGHDHF